MYRIIQAQVIDISVQVSVRILLYHLGKTSIIHADTLVSSSLDKSGERYILSCFII